MAITMIVIQGKGRGGMKGGKERMKGKEKGEA